MAQNVKVAVRCRPLNAKERALECDSVIELHDNNSLTIVDPNNDDVREFYVLLKLKERCIEEISLQFCVSVCLFNFIFLLFLWYLEP